MNETILKGLADNQPLIDALRTKFEARFQASLKEVAGLSTQEAGMFAKSRVEGMQLVDEVFKEIARLKTPPKTVDKPNPAR